MARTSKYNEISEAQSAASMWRTGLYLRLSREDGDIEDGDKFESDSIESQKMILNDHCAENPDLLVCKTYIDDGYTGTNFSRPDFQNLLEDIRTNKINCVVVKDLSRFARNYVEAGQYLEVYFRIMQIRFISVIDYIDSYLDPHSINNASVALKNVMNEEYCRDTSIKIRSVLSVLRENGDFIGAFAPYGYKKDADDYHKLVIDETPAENVRNIFKLFLAGNNPTRISKMLNELSIPSPSLYKKMCGSKYKARDIGGGLWSASAIKRILTDRNYIGDVVQGKKEKISHKIEKFRTIKQADWLVVENVHEPIIDRSTFDKVQDLLNRDTRTSPKDTQLGLFAGFIKCADCRHAMVKRLPNAPKDYFYYVCRTYTQMSKDKCTRHSVRSDILENVVFTVISQQIQIAVEMEELIKHINRSPAKNTALTSLENAIEIQKKEKAKVERVILELYPDWKNDLISREQYVTLKAKYETELAKIDSTLNGLLSRLAAEKDGIDDSNNFVSSFIKHKGFTKLTREMLAELVNNIYIHQDGGITIDFKFSDSYESAVEYINQNQSLLGDAVRKLASITKLNCHVQNLKEAQ
jgi:DNA invertase Pin-like site-specific DNA recombinase